MKPKKKAFSESEIGTALGEAIAVQRKSKGLTQNDLAGLVDVDSETISRFERGSTLPSLQRLWRIAAALDIGMGELLSAVSSLPRDHEKKVLATISELTQKDQQLLLDIAGLLRLRK